MEHVIDGRFRLLAPLGNGATSRVFSGIDEHDASAVAVKLADELVAGFEQAAAAHAALDHPNIVAYVAHGVDPQSHRPYLAMRPIDGVDLIDRMRDVVSTNFAVRIALDVARALQHAHARGIVHRDLKPENVMLTRAGDAVVLDFGLTHWGTPLTMAPEQWREEPLTGATDLYALGVMLFELLEGTPPFRGGTVHELRRLHCAHPPPAQASPFTPAPVRALVERLLAKHPEDRPAIDEVISVLADLAVPELEFEEDSWAVTDVEPP